MWHVVALSIRILHFEISGFMAQVALPVPHPEVPDIYMVAWAWLARPDFSVAQAMKEILPTLRLLSL
jgi:hypothetical protein